MSGPTKLPEESSGTHKSQEEFYKTLVTDDEVVAALIKDSKRREGTLDVERMKPNLNFLKRTVSNLVSTNTRIDENQDTFKTIYTKENEIELKVLQQIRLENQASTSRKPDIDFEFEKDIFLKTDAIDFEKSNEEYSTVRKNDVIPVYETPAIFNISETNKKPKPNETSLIKKDFLRKELAKINKKIERVSSKQIQNNVSGRSNKTTPRSKQLVNNKKPVTKNTTINSSNLSHEEFLQLELTALNAKIQEKLSKMKSDDIVLILDQEENGSDVEIVNLESSDEYTNKDKDKIKCGKVKILQNIEISSKKSSQAAIRKRMVSRLKQNKLDQQNATESVNDVGGTLNNFVCTQCGSCNSNDIVDKKACTEIKCETIKLSSSSSSDLEIVSVKIEPKFKINRKVLKSKKTKKHKKSEKISRGTTYIKDSKGRTNSRINSSSSESSRDSSWDKEREYREKQRKETYKARKESFRSTIRDRTKSRDSRERSTSRNRRANFREKDRERSSSKVRRARSPSRFSTAASYERYIKYRDKFKSKSRSRSKSGSRKSGSRDSKKRDSSTDSEQERYQAHMLAQQRFEERARKEYWMNRIIREYQNRYRIPRIPQRHQLVEAKRKEPLSVQSKVVVVPKKEINISSESDYSKRKTRSYSSDSYSSECSEKNDSVAEKSLNLVKYTPIREIKMSEKEIPQNSEEKHMEKTSNSPDYKKSSLKSPETSKKLKDSGQSSLSNNDDISSNIDEKSPKKRLRKGGYNQSQEEGEISDKSEKKKTKLKKKRDKEKKKKDKYMWKQVEISSNVTLHLGTEQ